MKNLLKKLAAYAAISIVGASLNSCLAPADNDVGEEDVVATNNSKITASATVKSPWTVTRSSEENVPLPIRFYLFSEEGKCIGLEIITDASSSAEFDIPRGVYSLYALCGDLMDSPTQETANLSDFYELATDNDVCLGHNDFSINAYGGTYEIPVLVNHIYSKVSLVLHNVPESVSAISAVFKSLYSSVSLNQAYSGTNDVIMQLTQDSQNEKTWILPTKFIYPSMATGQVIALGILSADGTEQIIVTTTQSVMKEGASISLSAQFQSLSSVATSGVVIDNGWTETSEELNFWDGNKDPSSTDTEIKEDNQDNQIHTNINQNSESSNSISELFKIGTQYGDTKTMILSAEENPDGTVNLLLVGTILLSGDDASVEYNVQTYSNIINLDTFASGQNWRIPTSQEFLLLANSFDAATLSTKISQISGSVQSVNSSYKFIAGEKAYVFGTKNGSSIVGSSTYYCLPVVSVIVSP